MGQCSIRDFCGHYESLVLTKESSLIWGAGSHKQIDWVSWECYFVLACLPWDQGCAHFVVFSDYYRATIRNMIRHAAFPDWESCGNIQGLESLFLLIIFYTKYIRVYLLEYMLYTKGNFIGDPAHWLAEGLNISYWDCYTVTVAQTY